MKMKPLHDYVLVRRIAAQDKTPGGIVLPDNAKEKPQKGKVVSVGPGKMDGGTRLPMSVKEGDIVVFTRYGGNDVPGDHSNELLLIRESDLLGTVEE